MTSSDNNQLMTVILNNIEDGIFVLDAKLKIVLFNQALSNITGYLSNKALNKPYAEFLKLTNKHGIHLDKLQHPVHQAYDTNQAIRCQDTYILTKDKQRIPSHLIVSPISDAQGRLEYLVGVLREMKLEKQQEEAKTDFISTASHEMRTPIASLEGYLSLLLEADLDQDSEIYVQKAHEVTTHLGQLFKDLLTTSQSEDSKLPHEPIIFNLINLLQDIIKDYQFQAQAKSIKLDFSCENLKSDLIEADPKRIEELLINILDNALKYTDHGGRIKIYTQTEHDYYQITIEDNGLGISQTDLPHIFQKFYRVDNSQSGTGLGLFICRKIVELYQGDIWVDSTLDQGTKLKIRLPYYLEGSD